MCISAKESTEEMDAMGDYCDKTRSAEIVAFQARAGLHRFCAPPESNSSGSIWIDLLTFWCIKLPHINWGPLFGLALLAICGALVAAGIYGFASSIDWGHVLQMMWAPR